MTPKGYKSIAIASICAVYIAVRLWGLTSSCLWFDEVFSVHAAEHPWNLLFWFVAQDLIHPPLFYVLLKIWTNLGGESLFWLRSFSVLFAVLAVFPFLHLCKELKIKFPAAAIALALFAVNGSLIKYAQELRMYSLLLFLGLMSMWLFSRFYYRGKNIWVLTLVNILLVYTHYFGWFTVAAEVLAILLFQRVKIRHVLIMSGIAIVTYIPWLIAVFRASNAGAEVTQNIGWIATPGLKSIPDFIIDGIEPFYFQASSADPSTLAFITVPLAVLIVIASIIFFAGWRKMEDRSAFYLLAIFCGVPIVIAFSVSWIMPVSIWGSRHLILAFPSLAIITAVFLTEIPGRVFRAVLISGVGLIAVAAFAARMQQPQPEYIWCEWEKAAAQIPPGETSTVYVFEELIAYHLWFSLRDKPAVKVVMVRGSGVPEDTAYFLPRGFDGVEKTDGTAIKDDEIWLAFRTQQYHEKHPPLSVLLSKGYSVAEIKEFGTGPEKAYLVKAVKN